MNLREFINDKLLKDGGNWRGCVQFPDPALDGLEQLIKCTETPSWQTFTLSYRSDEAQQTLDPAYPLHKGAFHVAAIFSRIVSRGLELDTYNELHKTLTDPNPTHGITLEFTVRLGRLLLSLRHRIACWMRLPDLYGDIEERNMFIERVHHICKIIYFYFFDVKNKRLPKSMIDTVLPETWQSLYADANPRRVIVEKLPTVESMDGFEQWMQDG